MVQIDLVYQTFNFEAYICTHNGAVSCWSHIHRLFTSVHPTH